MEFNLYEIAEVYGVSYQYIHKKFKELQNQLKSTKINQLKSTIINRKITLKGSDLQRLIEFLKYDFNQLKSTSINQNQSTKINQDQPEPPTDQAEMIEFLKQQLTAKDELLKEQQKANQQLNGVLMATQKNMNDLLQQHNNLKLNTAKKDDLLKQLEYDKSKIEDTTKAIIKLKQMIDDALLAKRLKDGIKFSQELLKEKKKLKSKKTFFVTKIIDGDTFEVSPNWTFKNDIGNIVRPAGYDTPEQRQPGYKQAKEKLTKLILGKNVELKNYIKLTYERLLCTVYIDGKNLKSYFKK